MKANLNDSSISALLNIGFAGMATYYLYTVQPSLGLYLFLPAAWVIGDAIYLRLSWRW